MRLPRFIKRADGITRTDIGVPYSLSLEQCANTLITAYYKGFDVDIDADISTPSKVWSLIREQLYHEGFESTLLYDLGQEADFPKVQQWAVNQVQQIYRGRFI